MNELTAFVLGGMATSLSTALFKSLGVEAEKTFTRILNGTNSEALSCYIESINNSSLPPIEKVLLIQEAPTRIRKLRNKKSICSKAFEKLNNPNKLQENLSKADSDKIHLILEEAEKVSNNDIQEIWSFILKRTIEDGGVSKRLIHILSKLDSYEANAFDILCNYLVLFYTMDKTTAKSFPLGTGFFNGAGNQYGFKIDTLKRGDISRLVNAGLIQIQTANYEYKTENNAMLIYYLYKRIHFNLSGEWIKCGHFRFTFEGEELYNCTNRSTDDFNSDYFCFVKDKLIEQGTIIKEEPCEIGKIIAASHF